MKVRNARGGRGGEEGEMGKESRPAIVCASRGAPLQAAAGAGGDNDICDAHDLDSIGLD